MKDNENIIILGGNIVGMYAAVKCVELGYDVTIIDKKKTFGNLKTKNYHIFNRSHTTYMNLLNKFNINYIPYHIKKNEKLTNIIAYIINKAKLIPKKNIISQSFAKFCKSVLSSYEYEVLKTLLYDFENIYSNINTIDCINMFINDINLNQEYFLLDDHIDILIDRIKSFLMNNNVTFINNTDIKDFKYINDNFILYSSNNVYMSNLLITTLSKKNLLAYKFWNKEQKALLNMVSNYNINSSNIYRVLDNSFEESAYDNITEDVNIRTKILEEFHTVYPNINKNYKENIYLWNIGTNNIIVREKLKYIYNPYMILCSDSYSKSNLFINYCLEMFDSNIPRIIKICSNY
jgi:hypothetical protein